jgi:hypothetical protein
MDDDLQEQVLQIEAHIEELADVIERCRKIILISKAAVVVGGTLILATIIGAIGFEVPPVHNFAAFKFSGTASGKKIRDYQEEILESLERELGKSKETTKFANDIVCMVSLHSFRGIAEKERVVPDLMRADIEDNVFVQSAVKAVLTHLVPGFDPSNGFHFKVFKSLDGGYFVDTDLDFAKLNSAYHKVVPPSHSTITQSYLLAHLLDARADTFFAAYYMAEPVTVPVSSDIMRMKHFEFLRRKDVKFG